MKRGVYQFFSICCLTLFSLVLTITVHASPESQIKVAEGRSLFFNNGNYTTAGLILAKVKFDEAVKADPNDYEARLFLCITRLPALMDNTLSYKPGAPIENVREFLDSLGVDIKGRNIFNWTAKFSKDAKGNIKLPSDVPALREYQDFLKSGILPEVESAISDLANIPNSINTILKSSETGEDRDTEVDYGDVLLFKSGLYMFKTFLLIILSYDVNVNDADEIVTKISSKLFNVDNDILRPYPQFFNLLADSSLSILSARSTFLSAINTYLQASDFIRNETDSQNDDLFSLDAENQAEESDFRANLERIKNSIVNKVPVEIGLEPLHINFSEFFEDPVNIRDHLPVFKYNPYTNAILVPDLCTAPDRSFSGIFPYGLPNCMIPACTATINGNLSLHIPLLSNIKSVWGASSYWTDFVCEFNSTYPALIFFKLTNAGIINSSSFSCAFPGLFDEFKIHIPDVLLPDGTTHLWVDLEYSPMLSTDANVYFALTGYGILATPKPTPKPTPTPTPTPKPTPKPSTVLDYFPHSLGSSWTYNQTLRNSSTSYVITISAFSSNRYTAKTTLPSTSTLSNYSYDGFFDISRGVPELLNSVTQGTALSYDSKGHLTTSTKFNNTCSYSPPESIFPSSFTVGASKSFSGNITYHSDSTATYYYGNYPPYHYTDTSIEAESITTTVEGLESVSVPAGVFANAIKLKMISTYKNSKSTSYLWYAKNVGKVRSTTSTVTASGSSSVTDELVNYLIK